MENSLPSDEQECPDCPVVDGSGSRLLLDWFRSTFTCTNCGYTLDARIMTLGKSTGYQSINYRLVKINSYNRLVQFEIRIRAACKKNGERAIPPDLIHMLKCRFSHIHSFYVQRFAGIRKNIPKYSYLAFKLLILVRRPDLASYFSIPKTRKTLVAYERIWAIICTQFEWEFISSCLEDHIPAS